MFLLHASVSKTFAKNVVKHFSTVWQEVVTCKIKQNTKHFCETFLKKNVLVLRVPMALVTSMILSPGWSPPALAGDESSTCSTYSRRCWLSAVSTKPKPLKFDQSLSRHSRSLHAVDIIELVFSSRPSSPDSSALFIYLFIQFINQQWHRSTSNGIEVQTKNILAERPTQG